MHCNSLQSLPETPHSPRSTPAKAAFKAGSDGPACLSSGALHLCMGMFWGRQNSARHFQSRHQAPFKAWNADPQISVRGGKKKKIKI